MEIYQVTYKHLYPDYESEDIEQNIYTAFVMATSFNEAQRKVEREVEKEFESVEIKAICIPENVKIII